MKRASLSALPARPRPEPADLTDRLLEREAVAEQPAAGPSRQDGAPTPPGAVKTAGRKRARPARPAAVAPKAASPSRRDGAPGTAGGQPLAPGTDDALRQAAEAAAALRQAARSAPARYELAVRYRLEALAHHVQQVAEFIQGRAQPKP